MTNSISNNFNIYSINKLNAFNARKICFSGLKQDVFVKTLKENKVMSENNFQPCCTKLDQNIITDYKQKIKVMPLIMDRMMNGVLNYTSGKTETKAFAENFLNDSISLATRIDMGNDKLEYRKNYSPEIAFIEAVVESCNNFLNDKIGKTEFDSNVEKQIATYSKTEFEREKLFFA